MYIPISHRVKKEPTQPHLILISLPILTTLDQH